MPQATVQTHFDPFLDPPAMDGTEGFAADARMPEPDPDWQPL